MLIEPEKGPGALAEALNQPGFNEQPQMSGNPRLRLTQYFAKVGYAQLAVGEKRENAQPRPLAGGLERAADSLKRKMT